MNNTEAELEFRLVGNLSVKVLLRPDTIVHPVLHDLYCSGNTTIVDEPKRAKDTRIGDTVLVRTLFPATPDIVVLRYSSGS